VEYRYEIDRDDRIRFVDWSWLEFARSNGAEDLTLARVIGASLWTFIDGSEVLRVYGLLLERVRRSRAESTIPFRCDAPEVRRDMELRVRVLPDGAVAITGVLIHETPHPRVRVLDTWAPRSRHVVRMCSWCKRTLMGTEWVDVEAADALWADADDGDPPRVRHGICPRCEAVLIRA